MLPHPSLKPLYDKLVWVYVYRDFSGSKSDRAAERILLRFGVSSWPQLFLADPNDWSILKHTGRTPGSFLAAAESVSVRATTSKQMLERTRIGEELAFRLEERPTTKLAREALEHDDIVARSRALGVLASKDPKFVIKRAEALLEIPNDPFRYRVCDLLKEAAEPSTARALEAIVTKPIDSLNPNVLRIHAVEALGTCGDARSVPVIAPFAQSGEYFNGLTGKAVDALAAIGKRKKAARKAVRVALKAAYPPPPQDDDARAQRACVALARRIHKALGEKRPFPAKYDEKARAKLVDS